MTQPQEPPEQSQQLASQPLTPLLKDRVDRWLEEKLDVLHVVGTRLLGGLWMTLFESIQDAIVLGLLVKIPGLLSKWVIGQEFSGLDACWLGNNEWSIARYACYAVVISDYTL